MVTRWLWRSLLLFAWSAPALAQEISATLRVDPVEVPLGGSVMIHQEVRNTGSTTVSGLFITLTIHDTSLARIVAEFSDSVDLAPGAVFQAVRSFSPQAPEGTVFDVLLTSIDFELAGTTRASFRVAQRPVRLELAQELPRTPRVLAYVDCGAHDGRGHDGHRHERDPGASARCEPARQLEALLRELQVAHVVVRDERHFLAELRSGRHNVYLVAGRICGAAGDALGELREAVFRGDGLLVDGSAGESELDRVAGVQRGRRLRFARAPMRVSGPLYTAARLRLAGGAWRFEPTTGEVQASFLATARRHSHGAGRDHDDDGDPDDEGDSDDDDRDQDRDRDGHGGRRERLPAIVSNEYGRGRALAFAFDFQPSYRKAAAAARASWERLLAESLEYLTPQPASEIGPLDYSTLATRVANAGAAGVDAELAFTLPAGMEAEDAAPPAPRGPDGVLRVRASVAAGERRELRLGLRMPGEPGRHPVDIAVSVCSDTACSLLETLSFPFEVASAVDGADGVIAELSALSLVRRGDRAARDEAVRQLTRGIAAFDGGRYERAIRRFVEAGESLGRIRGADVSEERLAVARMLAEAERRWWSERS